jgi:2'-5' RNA ligase
MQRASVNSMQRMVRLFIAVELPYDVKQELVRLQKIFQKSSVLVGTYPEPKVMHLTLKFIGDVPEQKVTGIQTILRGIQCKSMNAQLTLLMVFGNPRFPKVLYADVECPQLKELVHRLDDELKDFCVPEEREFKSHLTFARVRQTVDSDGLLELLDTTQINPLPFVINQFCLMQSKLTSAGPVHTTIECYDLSA